MPNNPTECFVIFPSLGKEKKFASLQIKNLENIKKIAEVVKDELKEIDSVS